MRGSVDSIIVETDIAIVYEDIRTDTLSSYTRKIINMHQRSYIISLPKACLRCRGLKSGDKLKVTAGGELTTRPLKNQGNRKGEIGDGYIGDLWKSKHFTKFGQTA